ncbi:MULTISPECIES: TolC family outer membrane protein [Aquitalea]|uniref:TolC family outer membrane protein n=1 Tax=Aquitalea TaxID=407217 RepID=UPI0013592A0F|nr:MULTISPECIES: TolC family outer membrane protein [Aquitalea]
MRNLRKSISLSVAIGLAGVAALLPQQASAIEVTAAVQQAILNNPEVLAKLHQFRGAGQDVNVGRAGYMPTVDLSYESNRQRYDYPSTVAVADQNYTTRGWKLSLSQNLFQGLQTYNTVKQLGYDEQAKYFDFLDSTESMALQTVQAYQDVLRYRQLLDSAQENYAIHKGIFEQISQKVQAGVGRRVDLEQAAGRLALAESNLITDTSNLHDVSVRYARLTGSDAPAQLSEIPSMKAALPASPDLIKNAVVRNPAYLSALSSVRSAQAEVNVRRGAFSPTLDLQASKAPTDNYDGYNGRTKISSVAVIFNMNLFRGGADRARLGSAAEKLNTTKDLRDKVCRDMRQTLSIANNNIVKLKDQMESLRQHQLSTEKARDAYRKQFDIGQRTLLDVLDSENELFDAQRAYINAQSDYKLAEATVLANSGSLLQTLKLKPVEDFKTDSSLNEEEQNACNTAYTPPAVVDVKSIAARQYTAAAAEPLAAAVPAAPLTAKPLKAKAKAKKPLASAAN